MALASATALSWRPLPPLGPRPSSSASPRSATLQNARVSAAVCTSAPRFAPRTCLSSSSSGCGSLLSNFILRNSLNSLSSSFVDVRLKWGSPKLERKRKSGCGAGKTRAGMRLDPGGGGGGGGGNDGGIGRVVVNVALAGGFAYLTVTGKLGWVFDTLISLWLLAVIIPIISFVAFLWFAEREIVKGACPNCGQAFQVFEFAVKEPPNLCPYCSQPFKLDSEKQFVRDEPRFSNSQRSNGFGDVFGGFGREPSRKKEDPGGVIVDVEAEVVDRD